MPVYHMIFHTFGSWLPDHEEGYYDRDKNTHHQSNAGLAEYYRSMEKAPERTLSDSQQQFLIQKCRDLCDDWKWGLHAIAVVSNHMHVVLSWAGAATEAEVKARLKQHLTHALNKQSEQRFGRWFSRGAGVVKIDNQKHLLRVVKKYIPEHTPNVWIEERICLAMERNPPSK